MKYIKHLWRKLTNTDALAQSSGQLENDFFESVYRVSFVAGLSTADRSFYYLLYSNLVKTLLALQVCGEAYFLYTEISNLDSVCECLNIILLQFIAIYRYKVMLDHKDLYNILAKAMISSNFDISTPSRKQIAKYWMERNEKYLKLLLGIGNLTLILWIIYPLVDDLDYNLGVAIRVPFSLNTPLRYTITFIIARICFHYISHFIMVNDLIMQAYLIHLLCQFNVLGDCFENILTDCAVGFQGLTVDQLATNDEFIEKYKKRLRCLVEQHQFILNNSMMLRNILSAPMLGQMCASGMIICFIGYQATTVTGNPTQLMMSLLFLMYNLCELYVICKWCEEIKVQSVKIGDAAYHSGWELGMSKVRGVRSSVTFIIARASRPVAFTAGGMYDVSLASFSTLVKTSYSALTVLLRFRND